MKLLKSINPFSLVVLFLIINMFSSCNREEKNQFSGIVSDLVTGKKLSNVSIILESNRISSGSISTNFTRIGEFETDEDGRYNFFYEAFPAVSFRMIFSKNGYLNKTIEFPASDYVSKYQKDEKLAAASHLLLRVRNIYPFNQHDNMKLRITGKHNQECQICCHSNFREFKGTSVNEYISCPVIGGDSIYIMVIVDRVWSSQPMIKEYALFAPINDTLRFNIDY